MDIQIPWSSWFTKKTRRKPDDWMIVEISLEEEFAVEMFLRDKKRICYGGTAINNVLPLQDQFYNKEVELPNNSKLTFLVVKDSYLSFALLLSEIEKLNIENRLFKLCALSI